MTHSTVKIVRFHELGGPEVLRLENVPLPEPSKGEVRLRVKAIGLNRAEIMFRMGRYLIQPQLPSQIGYEASGIVEAVGPDVDKQLIGHKFSTVPCFNLGRYGVYGEVAIVPTYALAAYPEQLSFNEATAIWMQYLTAYGALVHYGKITKGDFVVITAASSSVGIAACDIARAEGAISIAVTRKASKKAELLELGAHHVIVTEEEDLVGRVQEISGGNGARIIFDPIGGRHVEQLAKAAAMGGIIYEYGALAPEPTPFPLFIALSKGLTIRGYTLFEICENPQVRVQGQQYVFDRLQEGAFKPKIARTFNLEQIVEAQRFMESNEQIGKIVITV